MSDTPETDTQVKEDGWKMGVWVKSDFARKLERERDEARKERDEYASRFAQVVPLLVELRSANAAIGKLGEDILSDAVKLRKERDELRAEVEQLQADKARLDWLDSFNNTVTIQCEDGGIWIEIEDYKKVNDEPEKSLRDAIDAAMKVAE